MQTTRDLEEVARDAVVDGRYVVKRQVARGGVASVFEAEHVVTGASVALKTLHRPALDQPSDHQRLLREARILGGVRHANIVGIHDAGRCARHGAFLALEMVDGRPLDGILAARQILPVPQAVAVALEVCAALEILHARGVVHRDLKPSNLLVSPGANRDRLTLIDFGVAKVAPEPEAASEKLTKTGEVIGTVEYMAPEQLAGTPSGVDARSDVYAVGVILYECLSGEVPFSNATNVIAQMAAGPAPLASRRPEVPAALGDVVARALALDPAHRPASARELAQACVAAAGESATLDLLGLRADAPGVTDDATRRRRFVRAPYVTPVRLVLDAGVVDGRTADISEGGALIVGDVQCAPDQAVKVRIPMPTSGRVMTVDAITRWVKSHRSQRTIGVEFQDPPAEVREDIASYVRLMSSGQALS